MQNGYSLRKGVNYYRGLDGKWKLHSVSVWDEKGYTKKWATLEDAEQEAKERLKNNHKTHNSDEAYYIVYYKIYNGKQFIKEVRI